MARMWYQTWMKWFPIDLPKPGTFEGQVGLVTGGTGGLGLAAAVHLVNLGASEVIISSRNASRAENAIKEIERQTDGKAKGKIRVVDLDMSRFDSVVSFANEVKKVRAGKGGIDFAILNAGGMYEDFEKTVDGWEMNVQVLALSTALLAMLLLPWMKAERENRTSPAHLTIVGSSRYTEPDVQEWTSWKTEKDEGVLEHLNKKENFQGSNAAYPKVKLLAQYAFVELSKRALGPDGKPQVIMNTCCPGSVRTELARELALKGAVMRAIIAVYFFLFAKMPENGARTYMAALVTTESEHGKHIQFYKHISTQKNLVLDSDAGKKMQAQVWEEMTRELTTKVPEVQNTI